MKRAFTVIELVICVAIIAIIACIVIPNIAAQDLVGKPALWNGQRVHVLARDMKTNPTTYLVRTSANVEMHVRRDELSPVVDVEAQ